MCLDNNCLQSFFQAKLELNKYDYINCENTLAVLTDYYLRNEENCNKAYNKTNQVGDLIGSFAQK